MGNVIIEREKYVYEFDGESGSIDISDSLPSDITETGLTFSVWLNYETIPNDGYGYSLLSYRDGNKRAITFNIYSYFLSINASDENGAQTYKAHLIDFSEKGEHHFIFSATPSNYSVWIDGEKVLDESVSLGEIMSDTIIVGELLKGRNISCYHGKMSGYCIMQGGVTEGEVALLVENKYVRGSKYLMEETTGAVAFDSSGNGKHGTITGGITHTVSNSSMLTNHANLDGYSLGTGDYEGAIIPRSYLEITEDVLGGDLEFSEQKKIMNSLITGAEVVQFSVAENNTSSELFTNHILRCENKVGRKFLGSDFLAVLRTDRQTDLTFLSDAYSEFFELFLRGYLANTIVLNAVAFSSIKVTGIGAVRTNTNNEIAATVNEIHLIEKKILDDLRDIEIDMDIYLKANTIYFPIFKGNVKKTKTLKRKNFGGFSLNTETETE